MIERLLVALRYFAGGAATATTAVDEETPRRVAGDFLDAYRLIVDCPQYELGATARAALADVEAIAERLGDATGARAERERDLAAVAGAARRALVALGAGPS